MPASRSPARPDITCFWHAFRNSSLMLFQEKSSTHAPHRLRALGWFGMFQFRFTGGTRVRSQANFNRFRSAAGGNLNARCDLIVHPAAKPAAESEQGEKYGGNYKVHRILGLSRRCAIAPKIEREASISGFNWVTKWAESWPKPGFEMAQSNSLSVV